MPALVADAGKTGIGVADDLGCCAAQYALHRARGQRDMVPVSVLTV
jgi:hypothetical protein